MELALIFIIVLQIGYSVFKDIIHRDELSLLKTGKLPEKQEIDADAEESENPYISIEDASIEQILKAEDRL